MLVPPGSFSHFRIVVRGGENTKARLGVPFDVFRGHACNKDAIDFCIKFRFPQSFSCELATHEEQHSLILVNNWCSHMQAYYDCWLRNGKLDDETFSDLHWQEDEHLTAMAASCKSATKQRVHQVRTLKPKS